MLVSRLERLDGEYFLRISKHDIVQHDLHEGQLLAVLVEPLNALDTIGFEGTDRPAENWKLNEQDHPYEPNR